MVFSSFVFLFAFLPLSLVSYFAAPAKLKNGILLVFSLIFYAWGEPIWIIVLLFNVLLAWIGGQALDRTGNPLKAKVLMIISVACQVAFLVYFKYLGLLVDTFSSVTGISLPYSHPGLPIGISFFTFHLISYLVDVYRKDAPALRSYSALLLYISMFPQLVAGPIIRFADVSHQLARRTVSLQEFSSGIGRFAIGLGKKVIIANALADISPFFLDGDISKLSVLGAWFGILLFALHIYFDFSGYSDMAIGLGRMFGFHFKENFQYPYVSRSAAEFWRRWNISVGGFFRDYVYIPMGGNRRRPWLNLFVVWFLTGLWHGASWNYVVWGIYFGILIGLEKTILLRLFSLMPLWISHIYFALIVLVGWVFFYFESMSRGLAYLRAMFAFTSVPLMNAEAIIHIQNHLYLVAIALVGSTPLPAAIHRALTTETETGRLRLPKSIYVQTIVPIACTVLLVLSAFLLVGKTYSPFFYFRF
jgi:alginate O-acetyltransferase complex protein AlgI